MWCRPCCPRASAIIKLPEYRGHRTGCTCCSSAGGESDFQAAVGFNKRCNPIYFPEGNSGRKENRVCCTQHCTKFNFTDLLFVSESKSPLKITLLLLLFKCQTSVFTPEFYNSDADC